MRVMHWVWIAVGAMLFGASSIACQSECDCTKDCKASAENAGANATPATGEPKRVVLHKYDDGKRVFMGGDGSVVTVDKKGDLEVVDVNGDRVIIDVRGEIKRADRQLVVVANDGTETIVSGLKNTDESVVVTEVALVDDDGGEADRHGRTTICHRESGAKNAYRIDINDSERASHLAHGDYEGECDYETVHDDDDGDHDGDHEGDDDGGGKVTLCHRPPGNTANAHTISVGASAQTAHLNHGDTLGACNGNGDDDKEHGKADDDDDGDRHGKAGDDDDEDDGDRHGKDDDDDDVDRGKADDDGGTTTSGGGVLRTTTSSEDGKRKDKDKDKDKGKKGNGKGKKH